MRMDIFLNVRSAKDALKFYVEELALFELSIDYGMNEYLLSAIGSKHACISIREQVPFGSQSIIFGIEVENCDREFTRLKKMQLGNGARLLPGRSGLVEVSDFPIGRSFEMADPSANRFLIFEEYIPRINV